MTDELDQWRLFHGSGEPHPVTFPEAPPWRQFSSDTESEPRPYIVSPAVADVVNAALHLRRPLLVTGKPGTGKSSLATAVAHELGLGSVLSWAVNSRSVLADGLYQYDSIGRLRDTSMSRDGSGPEPRIGDYVRLGPLGTALAVQNEGRPRVLLIDELDKGDVDLPNDLLVVFEEGVFEIPELARLPKIQEQVDVMVTGDDTRAAVLRGKVRCRDFPVVVITSNGEREFPPAFLRRCVRLDLPEPTGERLREIVRAHLGDAGLTRAESLIDTFIQRRDLEGLATDQLLNAVHLRLNGVDLSAEKLLDSVLHRIGDSGSGLT